MTFDEQKHYDSCRDSAHGLATRFLNLLFQYVSFSVASLTAIGLLHNRVHPSVAIAIGTISIATCIYFRTIVLRYYAAARASISLCIKLEKDLFGKEADQRGVFSAISAGGGRFYTSTRIKNTIGVVLVLPEFAFIAVVVVLVYLAFQSGWSGAG
ncbi:MAG: hypothetical protein NXI31_20865 [bacterium]|nr:hypothetical protein [bacterium]